MTEQTSSHWSEIQRCLHLVFISGTAGTTHTSSGVCCQKHASALVKHRVLNLWKNYKINQ